MDGRMDERADVSGLHSTPENLNIGNATWKIVQEELAEVIDWG
jgi:hypothetical protein